MVVTDPQTWKDYLWLVLLSVIGFAFGIAAITLWATALGLLSVPLWWWRPPEGTVSQITLGQREWSADSWSWAAAVGLVGAVAIVLTTWICAGLARGQARLARLLLAPGLQTRIEELERTRAGAGVAQQDELERIERDLHDGA